MKVLFVATRKNSRPEDRELYEMDFMNELLGFRRSLGDLGLLTVAACTPPGIEVQVVDEYLQPIPYDTDADLVALSAKTSCVTHAYEVAARFRRRGVPVVLGGIHATVRPEEALGHVDHVITGEAETTWPRFLEAYRRGEAPRRLDADGYPPMERIPRRVWHQVPAGDYLFHQIQTTRGCPFHCRFCSVPDISGNTFRFKPVEQVVEEIRALPRSGWLRDRLKTLYFVDDNFISRTRYTKELLRALAALGREQRLPAWSAETTLNVARDEELLDLFAAAGCTTLIIGFESIGEATLEAMNKPVNFCLSFQESIARIHRRGMSIVGNFIVGFDTDTPSVFRDTLAFVDQHLVLYPFFSILTPMPGTALHDEFHAKGRLDHLDWARYDTRHVVFEPRHMSREMLMDGYIWLYNEAYTGTRALDRLEAFWERHRRRASGRVEHAFIRYRLERMRDRTSARWQRLCDEGWRRLTRCRGNADVAQLLYYLDAAHFADYLDRFRSPRYEEHARFFEGRGPVPRDASAPHPSPVPVPLARKQWEHRRLAAAS